MGVGCFSECYLSKIFNFYQIMYTQIYCGYPWEIIAVSTVFFFTLLAWDNIGV